MATLREYYHLKKETFSIDPWADAGVYFGGQALEERITRRLESDFVQKRGIPKFFIQGQYGAGKTHTLAHISHALADQLSENYPTQPIYFELAPIRAKERWASVHERLIDHIGLSQLKKAVEGVLRDPGDPIAAFEAMEVLRYGDTALKTSQAWIFRNLLFGGPQERLSWEWLKGMQLKVDQAQTLGTETNLTEPGDFIACLLNVANLVWRGTGKRLILLVDEAESVRSLSLGGDSHQEFVFAFRKLTGDENNVLGLIVAYQIEGGMEKAPPVFDDDAIRRRVGFDAGYIDLGGLLAGPDDVHNFILQILGHLVDKDGASSTIDTENLDTEPAFFPFTIDAVETMVAWISDDPERAIPSQIITRLSDAVVEGWHRRASSVSHVLVDQAVLDVALYPDQV